MSALLASFLRLVGAQSEAHSGLPNSFEGLFSETQLGLPTSWVLSEATGLEEGLIAACGTGVLVLDSGKRGLERGPDRLAEPRLVRVWRVGSRAQRAQSWEDHR